MRTTKETPFTIGIIANRWMRNDGRGFNYPHVVRSMGESYYTESIPTLLLNLTPHITNMTTPKRKTGIMSISLQILIMPLISTQDSGSTWV